MAASEEIHAVLTLKLGPDKVPAQAFLRAVRIFTEILADLAQEAKSDTRAVGWEISVEKGSQVLRADIGQNAASDVARNVLAVVERPPPRVRKRFRELSRLPIEGTQLWAGENRNDLLREVEVETPQPFDEYGTIEGELSTLSNRGGPHFTIYEPIWDTGVRCTVPDALIGSMQEMWTKRVAAHGLIRYDAEGHPLSISAEQVEPFPYDETPIEEFRGLYRDG